MLKQSSDSNLLNLSGVHGDFIQTEDVEFYEDLLKKSKDTLRTPLMTKRVPLQKEDPTEELIDVHIDI